MPPSPALSALSELTDREGGEDGDEDKDEEEDAAKATGVTASGSRSSKRPTQQSAPQTKTPVQRPPQAGKPNVPKVPKAAVPVSTEAKPALPVEDISAELIERMACLQLQTSTGHYALDWKSSPVATADGLDARLSSLHPVRFAFEAQASDPFLNGL